VIFEGSFVEAMLQGPGVMRYPCGVVFEGDFQKNLRTKGVFTWPNGDQFVVVRMLFNKDYAGKGRFHVTPSPLTSTSTTNPEVEIPVNEASSVDELKGDSRVQPFRGRVFVCRAVKTEDGEDEEEEKEFVVFEWDNGDIWKAELESEEEQVEKGSGSVETEMKEENICSREDTSTSIEENPKEKKKPTKRIVLNGFQLTNAAGENMLKKLIVADTEDVTKKVKEPLTCGATAATTTEPQQKKQKLR